MTCPACGADTKVCDSRNYNGGVRRRRECLECERRFTTLEVRIGASRVKKNVK